ncbi:MAG: hypothetical protein WCI71_19775 [Bacteroidota bacterium]
MKQIILIGCFLFIFQILFSQAMYPDSLNRSDFRRFKPHIVDYHLTLGSEFFMVSGFGSGISTYVTPSISYAVNNRLRIGGGISLSATNYFNMLPYSPGESAVGTNGNFTSATIFVNGQYLVNDRLTIFGSAFKQFPVTADPLPYNPFNPVSKKGAQGINVNMDYRFGRNFHIQAGFRYTEGLYPGYFNTANPFSSSPWDEAGGVFGCPRSW